MLPQRYDKMSRDKEGESECLSPVLITRPALTTLAAAACASQTKRWKLLLNRTGREFCSHSTAAGSPRRQIGPQWEKDYFCSS